MMTTEFLNFSDALHHARWGDKIARRAWNGEHYAKVSYPRGGRPPKLLLFCADHHEPSIYPVNGTDIMAEDWYVV